LSVPTPQVGETLTTGVLFRRIPNTDLSWSYKDGGPGKIGFRPDKNETGISTFLTHLTTKEEVLRNHEGYGLCTIDIPRFLADVERMRATPKLVVPENLAIRYAPSAEDGPAHCYIEPVPGLIQKALRRVAVVVQACSPPVEPTA
jgi:hypothetical protein